MRVLDLFAGIGGAGYGYMRAGLDVLGVELEPAVARHYPGPVVVGDALEYAEWHAAGFDLVHASPPCQLYSHGTAGLSDRSRYVDLIGPTRDLLTMIGVPYVIENVPRAPLLEPVRLCGTMWNLGAIDDDGTPLFLQRHRLFEANWALPEPAHRPHPKDIQWAGVYGGAQRDKHTARHVRHGGYVPSGLVQRRLMGIGWGTIAGVRQAIPPAYSEYIGREFIEWKRAAA